MRGKGSKRTMAAAALCCAAAAVLALGLSACGSNSSAATAESSLGAENVTAIGSGKKGADQGGKQGAPEPATCSDQLGGFIDSMAALRTDLVTGLSYEDYVARVQSIRGDYHQVPVKKLALTCLRAAGTPAERGLNKYIEAGNAWTECVETPGCESASVEPALQSRWRQASKRLSEAEEGLKEG